MMRNTVFIFVVLALIFNFGESAVSILPDARNDKYPGKCYYSGVKPALILSPGGTASVPGRCSEAHCNDDLSMDFVSCGLSEVEGCKKSDYDLTKAYPECCPKPICP